MHSDKQPSFVTGIHHISLETSNWEKSLQFYVDLLGLNLGPKGSGSPKRMQLLDAGGSVFVELTERTAEETAEPSNGRPLLHLALRVSDTAALMEKVKSAGYEVTMDTRTIHTGDLHAVIGFFKGPQGELIESFQVLDTPKGDA